MMRCDSACGHAIGNANARPADFQQGQPLLQRSFLWSDPASGSKPPREHHHFRLRDGPVHWQVQKALDPGKGESSAADVLGFAGRGPYAGATQMG